MQYISRHKNCPTPIVVFFLLSKPYQLLSFFSKNKILGMSMVFKINLETSSLLPSCVPLLFARYIASPGLEARVIESTVDESLSFVSPYTSPAMWKRNTIPGDKNYDNYNPLTAADRYHQLAVEDMGTSPNPVLPR